MPKDKPTVAESKPAEVQAVSEPRFFDFDYEKPPTPAANAKPAIKVKQAPAAKEPAANQPQWTLVLGTFADHRRAIDLARQVKPEPGLVTTTIVGGEVRFLVSTRPLTRDQDVGRQLNVAALKLESVKLMPVCPAQRQNDTCIALDQSLEVQQAILPYTKGR
jgi:hypothetical protein